MNRFLRWIRLHCRWLISVGVVLVVGVCVWYAFAGGWIKTVYRGGAFHSDGEAVTVRQVVWEPTATLPSAKADSRPLAGGARIVISQATERGDFDLFVRERTADGWSIPRPLDAAPGELNTAANEISPCLSPTGDLLVFASDRPGGIGGMDLWVSRRTDAGWEPPTPLGPRVNSPYDERDPTIGDGGMLLVFATDRPVSFLSIPPQDWEDVAGSSWQAADDNLAYAWRDRRGNGMSFWTHARPLEVLNTTAHERGPAFSPAGDFLYFSSDRAGGEGGLDLYRSRRLVGMSYIPQGSDHLAYQLEAPENLGAPPNSPADELAPILLDGGFSVLLTRKDEHGVSMVASRSLEVETEVEIGSLPVAAFVENLSRIALLAVASAALVVLSVFLVRTRRSWAVSLLARCAVVALVIHLAMLYGFYFWEVGSRIIARAERERRVEVTVESDLVARVSAEVNKPLPDLETPVVPDPPAEKSRVEGDSPALAGAEPIVEGEAQKALEAAGETSPDLSDAELAMVTPREIAPPESDLAAEAFANMETLVPERRSSAPDALPQAETRAPSAEPTLDLSRQESPAKAETSAAVPEPSTAPEVTAELPRPTTTSGAVRLATTPAQSFELAKLLPAAARAEPTPSPRMRKLPVPAQSPRPRPQDTAPDPLAVARIQPQPISASQPQELPKPTDQPTRLELPTSERESIPVALRPTLDAYEAEARFLSSPLRPLRQPYKVASSRKPLPEAALADKTSQAPADERMVSGPVREQRLESSPVETPAALLSTLATAAARPRNAGQDLAPAATPTLARLDARPTPGAATPFEAVIHARTISRRRTPKRFPEESALTVTDVLPRPTPDAPESTEPPATTQAGRESLPVLEPLAHAGELPSPRADRAETEGPSAVRSPRTLLTSALRRTDPSPAVAQSDQSAALTHAVHRRRRPASRLQLPEDPNAAKSEATRDIRQVRSAASRRRIVGRMGGSKESEKAVQLALDWFARHQSADGRWDVDGFDAGCRACGTGNPTAIHCDAAITGLVVLCFLGHNETPGSSSPYAARVDRALNWLIAGQTRDGNLAHADEQFTMYSHGIATLAVSEAYLMTRHEKYRRPLERACDLIIRAQNTVTGGWRYQPEPPQKGDTSITGWQVMALMSARGGGLKIPETVFRRSRHWLDEEAGGGEHGGLYGYNTRYPPQVAMVAEGLFARQVLGQRRGSGSADEAARYLHSETRGGKHLDNFYLLYYGTLALYQYQGWIWENWNRQVREFLISKQRLRGPLAGSWAPRHRWSAAGGRVLATAFATLTLEVYYRYLPLYWAPQD